MTMLNAAPSATAAPTGAGTTMASGPTSARVAAMPPTPAQIPGHAPAAGTQQPLFHDLGMGDASGAVGRARTRGAQNGVSVPLDAFSKQSGPDASMQTTSGMVSFHAVFQIDQQTRQLTVAIVNQDGKLVRLIPQQSVSKMIAAMAAYRGR